LKNLYDGIPFFIIIPFLISTTEERWKKKLNMMTQNSRILLHKHVDGDYIYASMCNKHYVMEDIQKDSMSVFLENGGFIIPNLCTIDASSLR
jgi:phosphosulfolactate phosphohydrolase-like enzyme